MNLAMELKQLLGKDKVNNNKAILEEHSRDESYHPPSLPDVVVFPESREDIVSVMRYAHSNEVPVVPFGSGSSVEGQVIPYQGGISLDCRRMNRILEVRPYDFMVRVQPGVVRTQLNQRLKKHGLFFPVDPGADATLGGMVATNASGTTSVRYGVTRDQVRSLEVVLADGRVIQTGGLSAKSSSGYDLNGIFTGSEGTLGVFTEIVLHVFGIPEAVMAVQASFSSVQDAVETALTIIASGVPVARLELVDARSMRCLNRYQGGSYPEKPTLFIELHGNQTGLEMDAELIRERTIRGEQVRIVADFGERNALWSTRHQIAYAYQSPGKKQMVTDVCVFLSHLSESIENAGFLLEKSSLDGGILGHVGDGNYHVILVLNPEDEEDLSQAKRINEAIVDHALRCGGTCTGEHGVGVGKKQYQGREHGDAYSVMKQFKCTLDPKGILNPGKIF